MFEKALIADLLTKIKVDVLQIWGSPALNVRMGPLVADLLAKIKVDVLQIWGSPALYVRSPPSLTYLQIRRFAVLQILGHPVCNECFEGPLSLTNARKS